MKIVEYGIKFRDMASSQVGKLTGTIQRSMPLTNKFASNIVRVTGLYKQSYDQLQAKIRATENVIRTSTIKSEIRAAKRELQSLQKEASKREKGWKPSENKGGGISVAGMLKGGLAVGAVMEVGRMAGAFLGGSIKDSLERQQIQTSFNVLAGDDKKGAELTKQLVDLQKNTILGKEVFQNAQTMMGFGIDSSEVIENMKMLGDVSMGDAQKLNSLTLAFSQIRSQGKMQGQDFLQLVNAGFNPLEEMSKRTGKSMATLKDEMAKGNISFAMVQQAFKDATGEGGKFNNMLAKIAETPAGKVKQLEGAWGEFKIAAGAAFMPLVSMTLDFVNKLLPLAERMLTPLTNGVSKFIELIRSIKPYFLEITAPAVDFIKQLVTDTGGWMDYVNTVKNLFVEHIYPVVKKLWSAVFGIASDILRFIKNSVILKDIFSAIGWVVGKIFDLFGGLVTFIKNLWDNIIKPIVSAIETAYKWVTGRGTQTSTTAKVAKVTADNAANWATPEDKKQTNLMADIKSNTAANNAASSDTSKAISGGGPKVVNIRLDKFFDNINISTTTLQESVQQIEDVVLECLSRTLMQGATNSQL